MKVWLPLTDRVSYLDLEIRLSRFECAEIGDTLHEGTQTNRKDTKRIEKTYNIQCISNEALKPNLE